MKKKFSVYFGIGLMLILFAKTYASDTGDEKLAVYFPYNYREQHNQNNWTYQDHTAHGDDHKLQLLGFGLRYFPNGKVFFDLSKKSLIAMPIIGENTHLQYALTSKAMIGALDSYALTVNCSRNLSSLLKAYAGLGLSLNNIEFNPSGRDAGGVSLDVQIFTELVRVGMEYKITPRCAVTFSIGYEQPKNIEYTYLTTQHIFKYTYKSPFYIEPAIMFYF